MTHSPDLRRTSEPALVPERLGRYEVLLPIASGGMATVYLARAVGAGGFERDVALKLTHFHLREDPDFVASLMDEARLAGQIRHPNVVSVLDVGDDPHGVFIVMEYVEGDSLAALQRALRKRGQLMPISVALALMADLLAGLHAAHELVDQDGAPLYVIHRDVTPHNVLLGMDGVTKLADFGIAKAASRLGNTATGLVKGKVAYMAPEQAQGHSIDRRVDVWAAGVIAWETFTGARLYDGTNDAAVLLKIVREAPLGLRAIQPEVPEAIEAVVAKALSLDVAGRYPTAEAFAEALSAAARAAGITRAERKDITEFLKPLLGERLEQRREKVREVRALRQRMGELTTLDPGRGSVAPPPAIEDQATATALSDPPTATHTELDGSAAHDATQTGTAGISTMARSILPPRRGRVLAVAAAAGAGLVALGLAFAFLGEPEMTPAPAVSLPTSPAATPTPTPTAEASTASAPEPGPPPSASTPAIKPKGPRPVPKLGGQGPGPSTAPKPLGNPYKKP